MAGTQSTSGDGRFTQQMDLNKGSEISSEHLGKNHPENMLTKQYVSDSLYDRDKYLENKI